MSEYNRQRQQSPNKAQARNALLNWKQVIFCAALEHWSEHLPAKHVGNSVPLHAAHQEAAQRNRTVKQARKPHCCLRFTGRQDLHCALALGGRSWNVRTMGVPHTHLGGCPAPARFPERPEQRRSYRKRPSRVNLMPPAPGDCGARKCSLHFCLIISLKEI